MLYQVAGRSGRAERPGRVMLQTYHPEHPVLQALASGNPYLFLDIEAEVRKATGMPPFGRLIALLSLAHTNRLLPKLPAISLTMPHLETTSIF